MKATHTLTLTADTEEPEFISDWSVKCHGKLTDCNHLTYCKDCTKEDQETLDKQLGLEYELDDWGEATVHGVEHIYNDEVGWAVWQNTCIAAEWPESVSVESVENTFYSTGEGEYPVTLDYWGEGIWEVLPADKKETGE